MPALEFNRSAKCRTTAFCHNMAGKKIFRGNHFRSKKLYQQALAALLHEPLNSLWR